MIGYVKGTVSHLFPEYCFVDVQGIGYRLFIAESTRKKLALGATASLFTYLHVREDALLLYGFYSQAEYDLFLHLLSVAGIGPKVAVGILSAADPQEFKTAIWQKNIAFLTKLPGIGRKTAERVILELKDKLGASDDSPIPANQDTGGFTASDTMTEVTLALAALGYTQSECMPILKRLGSNDQSVEELIRMALKEIGGRR